MPDFERRSSHEITEQDLMGTEQEVPLYGGNVTGAIRSGQTVRRAMGPWSASIHTLLRHLEASGFDGAPRFLSIDEQGREALSFIEGDVGHYPLPATLWSDASLRAVARFLRRYHDATVDYVASKDAVWQFVYPDPTQHEVICHGDVAPYNLVYRDNIPHTLIDFDTAGPGPRLWDLAYAAYRFVPLSYAQDMQELGLADPPLQARRLALFCHEYGMEQPYTELLDFVALRLQAMCDWLSTGNAAGDPTRQRLVAEGHLDHYQREIAAFQKCRHQLQSCL